MAENVENVAQTEEKEVNTVKKKKKINWKAVGKKALTIGGIALGTAGSFVLGVLAGSKAEQNKKVEPETPAAEPEVQPEAAPAEQTEVTDAQ